VQSICICGAKYLQHRSVQTSTPASNQTTSTVSQTGSSQYLNTSMASPWIPAHPVQGTMDQQRRLSIQHHPSGIPASSVPAYYSNPPATNSHRRQALPFPGAVKKVKVNGDQPHSTDFTVLIFPYPVRQSYHFFTELPFILLSTAYQCCQRSSR
jgi:hypothetical protein